MKKADLALIVVAAAIGCGGKGTSKDQEEKPAPEKVTVVEQARRVAATDGDIIEKSGDGEGGLLIVIGENHASVRSQLEVEAMLAALRGASILDAVGLEGSNGVIPIHTGHIEEVARLDPAAWRAHARDLVAWGEISGAEAFAITNPAVPHVGVEDMGAKARWELAQEENDEARRKKTEQQRRDEVERAVACLGEPIAKEPGVAAARRRLAAAQQRFAAAQGAWSATVAKLKPLREREIALKGDAEAMAELSRISWAAVHLQLEKELEAKRGDAAAVRDLEHARTLAKKMFPEGTDPITNPSQQTMEAFNKHVALTKEADQLHKSLPLEAVGEKLGTAAEEVADAFAEIASELGRRDDASGRCSRRVVHFVSEVLEPAAKAEQLDLRERDEHMVRLSLELRRKHVRVAIVVGYAHLPGIAQGLKQQGASFLAVAVKSREEEGETWEHRAWERRKERQDPLFVAGLRENKEVTLLVDASWWLNFGERARISKELGLGTSTRGRVVREKPGGQRVVRNVLPDRDVTFVTGDLGLGPSVDVGSHVISRGPTPTAGLFTGFDDAAARTTVAKLSDRQTHFGYARLADGGDPVLDLPAPGGKTRAVSLPELATGGVGGGGGGGRPRRVVMFEGMDAESSHQLGRDLTTRDAEGRPLWNRLATESLLFTVNAERAKKNLRRLDAQQAERIGGVRVVRGIGIEGLHPTPARGDNARMLVIVARNVAEFRKALERAARDGLLERKQIALVTCGDAFAKTAELREALLSGGAAMVWVPYRQLTEGLGELLASEVERTVNELPENLRGAPIDEIMTRTIERLKTQGRNPEIQLLEERRTYVMRAVRALRDSV